MSLAAPPTNTTGGDDDPAMPYIDLTSDDNDDPAPISSKRKREHTPTENSSDVSTASLSPQQLEFRAKLQRRNSAYDNSSDKSAASPLDQPTHGHATQQTQPLNDATVVDATVVDATVVDATVVDATVVDATVVDATVVAPDGGNAPTRKFLDWIRIYFVPTKDPDQKKIWDECYKGCEERGARCSSYWYDDTIYLVGASVKSSPGDTAERLAWYQKEYRAGVPMCTFDWVNACFNADEVVDPYSDAERYLEINPAKIDRGDREEYYYSSAWDSFNPFEGDEWARQTNETIDDFQRRLVPNYDLTGLLDGERIKMAYPFGFDVSYHQRVACFKTEAGLVLDEWDKIADSEAAKFPYLTNAGIRSNRRAEQKTILPRLRELAKKFDLDQQKGMIFRIEDKDINGIWNDVLESLYDGWLGYYAEVIRNQKTGTYTIAVTFDHEDHKDVANELGKLLEMRNIKTKPEDHKYKYRCLSLLGLRTGNRFGIAVRVIKDDI